MLNIFRTSMHFLTLQVRDWHLFIQCASYPSHLLSVIILGENQYCATLELKIHTFMTVQSYLRTLGFITLSNSLL